MLRAPLQITSAVFALGLMASVATEARADTTSLLGRSHQTVGGSYWGPLQSPSAPLSTGLSALPAFSPLGAVPSASPVAGPIVARAARPNPRAKPRTKPRTKPGAKPRPSLVSTVKVGAKCSSHRQCGKWGVCEENKCQVMRCKSDLACPAGAVCHGTFKVCKVVKRRPINILWLYFRSGDRRMTSVLGLYHHRKGRKGYRVVAPIYWHFWGRKGETRVVAPLYWSVHNKVKRTQHHFFLMFHYFRGQKPRQTEFNIWPLFFATSYGKRGGAFTLFPVFHYSRLGKRSLGLSLLPVPWMYYKRPGKVAWAVLPLTAGVRTPDKSFVWALPLNFYWRKKHKRHWTFFPLYYGVTDTKAQRHDSVLFPLFYYSRVGRHRHRFMSLLATYSRDRKEGWWYFLWTAPPIFFSRDREKEVDLVFPLYLRYHDRLRRSSLYVVPPVAYYKDHRQQNLGIFPLFFYFSDKRTKSYSTLLFPLFYRHRTADGERVTVVGPWYLRQRKTGWASGLFPVAFFGSHKKSSYAVVFPLLWHLRNKRKGRTFTLFGNVYATTGPRSWSFGIVPLIFAGRSPTTSHQVIFPLVWWYKNRVTRREFGVVGPAFWWKNGDSFGHGVFPLFWFKRRYLPSGHVVSSLLLFPLAYHLNTPRHRALITPLGGFIEDRAKRTKTHVWGPAFSHTSPTTRSFGVLPFFATHENRVAKTRTHFVFPLNIYHRSPKGSALVLFPLVWNFRRPGSHSLVVAPLYWHLRQKKGWNADVVFPIFWHLRKGNARTVVAGPIYWNRTPSGTRRFGLAPLLHVGWDKKSTYAHLFPFFWHYRNHEKGTGLTIAGPYFDSRRAHRADAGVLPLFYWGRSGPKDQPKQKRYLVGFPLLWHFSDAKKQAATTFLGPVFWHRRGKVTGGGVFPLLWVQRGPKRLQVTLAPLFHYARKAEQWDFWTPLMGFGGDRALNKSYGYVGPVYWESSPKRKAQVVFPLFWRFAHPEKNTSTTVLFPLYYGSKSRESRLDVIFPFVWLSRTVTSRTVFVLPLFYDRLDRDEARTTALFPLFYRRRVFHKKETTWLFPPALYIRKAPAETDVVLFPLLWHFGRQNRSTSVGFPLYWDFKRPGKRATVLFPLFWRFEKGSKVKMLVLNTWVSYDRSDKTYQVVFFPLVEVARKRPGDFKLSFLGGLFAYERIGRNRYIRLFFIPIELAPTPAGTTTSSGAPSGTTPGGPSRPSRPSTLNTSFYPI